MYIIVVGDGAVSKVLADWDAVLDWFEEKQKSAIRDGEDFAEHVSEYDIVELGTTHVMKKWESKEDNGAGLKVL